MCHSECNTDHHHLMRKAETLEGKKIKEKTYPNCLSSGQCRLATVMTTEIRCPMFVTKHQVCGVGPKNRVPNPETNEQLFGTLINEIVRPSRHKVHNREVRLLLLPPSDTGRVRQLLSPEGRLQLSWRRSC